jgi:hypothetical protein
MYHEEKYTSEGDVTLLDRQTGESKTIHWGPGHSIEYWWQDGNGSCDCNRFLDFYRDAKEVNIMEVESPCGNARFIVTHIDGKSVSFKKWNQDYE